MSESFWPKNASPISTTEARELSPLVLAFIGDGVYTLFVRCLVADSKKSKPCQLHKLVTDKVKATAQAVKMQNIMSVLTEDESDIYHRGRNAHVNSVAKNASIAEYKCATGFEALVGYLYLSGQEQRLSQLMNSEAIQTE